MQPVKVLIVDDSAVLRVTLKRLLEEDRDLQVVGTAANGTEALTAIPRTFPDVVVLDVEMPVMDGLDTLKRIVAEHSCQVIMLSAHTRRGSEVTVAALSYGAFDFVTKPESGIQVRTVAAELIAKIKLAAAAPRFRAIKAAVRKEVGPEAPTAGAPQRGQKVKAAVIGCSTGGPAALRLILPKLPASLPFPVIVVQHMPVGFTASLAHHLDLQCRLKVVHASENDVLEPGKILVAPSGSDFLLRKEGNTVKVILKARNSPLPPGGFCPSVDDVMAEAAAVYGSGTLGVLLTGMGRDGVRGMALIKAKGGRTIAQDRETSVVFGMPAAAIEAGAADKVVPLHEIAAEISSEV
ncbi:MAG: chemotaxis-specific protein-glutamate methyltransferase CheB [Bacillota bacterium]|uniref:chemotaxis-specific protein-glutamate methyltransferase CheB n=1 Tax=Desulforudis sp. DRI-14 TaxID=3459793 RepID=UPI00349568A6